MGQALSPANRFESATPMYPSPRPQSGGWPQSKPGASPGPGSMALPVFSDNFADRPACCLTTAQAPRFRGRAAPDSLLSGERPEPKSKTEPIAPVSGLEADGNR